MVFKFLVWFLCRYDIVRASFAVLQFKLYSVTKSWWLFIVNNFVCQTAGCMPNGRGDTIPPYSYDAFRIKASLYILPEVEQSTFPR